MLIPHFFNRSVLELRNEELLTKLESVREKSDHAVIEAKDISRRHQEHADKSQKRVSVVFQLLVYPSPN
jgi:hypothetical protein